MYKYIVYIAKPAEESMDAFRERYLSEHTQRVLGMEETKAYIANLIEPIPEIFLVPNSGFGNPGSGVDAIDEIWMEGEDFPIGIYEDENMVVVGGYKTIEYESFTFIAGKQYPLGQRTPLLKRLAFLGRRDDITREQFTQYWHEKHAPLANRIHVNAFDRYVHNYIYGTLTEDTKEWDGIVQMEFFTPEEFIEGFFSAVPNSYEIMLEDTHNYIGHWHENRPAYLMREYPMKRLES